MVTQLIGLADRIYGAWREGEVPGWVLRFTYYALGLFLLGFFFVPEMPQHYELFYWTLLPPAFLLAPRAIRTLSQSRLFWIVFAFVSYMGASAAWSEPFDLEAVLLGLRMASYILAFVALTGLLLEADAQRFDGLMKVLCLAAALTAVGAMVLFFHDPGLFPDRRLHGIARMQYVIRTGYAFGFVGILALVYLLRESGLTLRLGLGLVFATCLAAVILTESRAALAGLVLAVAILAVSRRPRWALVLLIGSVGLAGLAWLASPELAAGFDRGVPYRFQIWSHYLSLTWEGAPVFGYGLLSRWPLISAQVPYREAHSAFVGTFRDGGLVGLGLLLGLLGYAFLVALRVARRCGDYSHLAFLVYMVVCMSANDERLVVRPQELWLYLWLPLVFIMVREAQISGANRPRDRSAVRFKRDGESATMRAFSRNEQ